MVKSVRNDTVLGLVAFDTDHRMGLTTACLAVSEDSTVVSVHDRLNQRKGTLIIDLPLTGIFAINHIVSELSCSFRSGTWRSNNDLIDSSIYFYAFARFLSFLSFVHRSAPDHDLNALTGWLWSLNRHLDTLFTIFKLVRKVT